MQKMKKEIDQAERRANEKLFLEKQVKELQDAKKKDEAMLAKLQSDLEKIIELRSREKDAHKAEMVEAE